MLEDGIIKEGSHNIEQGAGIRAISGEKTGFAYSDELQFPALLEAARAARSISRSGKQGSIQIKGAPAPHRLYEPINPLPSLSELDKVELLRRVDAQARQQDLRSRKWLSTAWRKPTPLKSSEAAQHRRCYPTR